MFCYRLCNINDKECWIAMNREFMAEEIQDDSLWNNTGQTSDIQFANTFEGINFGVSVLVNDSGFSNTFEPIFSTDFGISILVNDLQL